MTSYVYEIWPKIKGPFEADSYPVTMGERRLGIRLRRALGLMGRDEGKIATGRFRFNMAAREESSLSRDVNNTLNEEKLAFQHRSCTVNNRDL